MNAQDFDICQCGDYRHQHQDQWRGCTICAEGDGMNGRACLQYRPWLAFKANWSVA